MELLLKTFSLSYEEFEFHNKKSTLHVRSYFDNTMDISYEPLFDYLNNIDNSLFQYKVLNLYWYSSLFNYFPFYIHR